MLLITGASSIPMDGSAARFTFLTSLKPGIQNLLHIPIFGFLAYLWLRAFFTIYRSIFMCAILALIITVVFGAIDEIHQLYVPGRYAGLLDIILNAVGAVMGVAVFGLQWRTTNNY